MCVHVCVCVSVCEREREREREQDKRNNIIIEFKSTEPDHLMHSTQQTTNYLKVLAAIDNIWVSKLSTVEGKVVGSW